MYSLSSRSEDNLIDVHPDLIKVVRLALSYSEIDFGITQGARTKEQQLEMIKKGVSQTSNSRHIPENNESHLACAVDVAAWVGGSLTWKQWAYRKIAKAMFRAAIELGIQIECGGLWSSLEDWPHIQLSRKHYP
jgi:peptidoglycan L-alanyl-D-glutamate endopeptidase CwlK